MQLGYFTEEAYEKLLSDIPLNKDRYSQPEEWLEEYFGNSGYYKNSSIEVGNLTLSYEAGRKTDEQKAKEDFVNTRLLYEAFKKLTPNQASNKYLWTYLCHAKPEFREYIRDRWMLEERTNTIEKRYFVTTPGSLINDNALSRLWWYGHLTYDKNNSNPYALTEILFTNLTICTDIMDTMNRRNHNRLKGVLLAVRDFKDIAGVTGLSDYIRECNKYLNRYAAVTKMEFLGSEEIKNLTFKKLMELRKRN